MMLEPDIFANPRYARFSLRTLLSVLICYLFGMSPIDVQSRWRVRHAHGQE
ncbi:hypothetical protein [Caballeronia sp.]|uniref:hypothetical protein n=1 Tax=Caballeronia sp. TaxID=1931223 RepID=UPI003C695462